MSNFSISGSILKNNVPVGKWASILLGDPGPNYNPITSAGSSGQGILGNPSGRILTSAGCSGIAYNPNNTIVSTSGYTFTYNQYNGQSYSNCIVDEMLATEVHFRYRGERKQRTMLVLPRFHIMSDSPYQTANFIQRADGRLEDPVFSIKEDNTFTYGYIRYICI